MHERFSSYLSGFTLAKALIAESARGPIMKHLMFLRLREGKITHHLLFNEPSLSWGPGGDQIIQMVAEAAEAAGLDMSEDGNDPFTIMPSFLNYEEAIEWYELFAQNIEDTTKIRFLWAWLNEQR